MLSVRYKQNFIYNLDQRHSSKRQWLDIVHALLKDATEGMNIT